MIALIDSDIPLYSVAYAADAEPLPIAIHSLNKMIDTILDEVGTDDYFCFLTGRGNYREDIATIKVYKGHRNKEKPRHYHALKEYLIKTHKARVIEGQEADDAMGIAQTLKPNDTVICSIDKDLDMIAGNHYNWSHHGKPSKQYVVSQFDADKFFYTQLLMGDSTDNIPGIPGVGPKKAADYIQLALEDAEEDEADQLEYMYWECLDQYSMAYDRPMEALLENARLLWIRRKKDELWEPPV